ncbi:hypothetical protein ES702_05899 [subsurface metagenome]
MKDIDRIIIAVAREISFAKDNLEHEYRNLDEAIRLSEIEESTLSSDSQIVLMTLKKEYLEE